MRMEGRIVEARRAEQSVKPLFAALSLYNKIWIPPPHILAHPAVSPSAHWNIHFTDFSHQMQRHVVNPLVLFRIIIKVHPLHILKQLNSALFLADPGTDPLPDPKPAICVGACVLVVIFKRLHLAGRKAAEILTDCFPAVRRIKNSPAVKNSGNHYHERDS